MPTRRPSFAPTKRYASCTNGKPGARSQTIQEPLNTFPIPTNQTQPHHENEKYGNLENYWGQDAQGRLYAEANRWYINSGEYLIFLNALLAGKLLSPASLPTMKSGQMGMTLLWGQGGKYYYHKGYMVKNGAGLTTAWMTFPNNLTVVLCT